MSKKRFNPLEDPPNASSSDEDDNMETTSLAGNSSSGEETEDESSALKKHQASDPESGSDEETDSDSQPETKKSPASSSAVKPITGTKNQDSKKAKPLSKSSTKKRSLSETGASTEAKKKVKSESGGGEETKKTYFQRVWSEEDEIAALQGLIDYRKDTGVSPYDDTNAFYGFVKKAISFEVSKTQLLKKLWGLKTKYENNLGKEKNGEELSFAKPHDGKAFGLSKLAWGADGVVALDSAVKSNGKSKKKSSKKVEPVKQEIAPASSLPCEEEVVVKKEEAPEVDVYEKSGIVKALARFGVDEFSAQRGWSRLALEDQKRFQEEWEVLERKELEFYAKKSGFIHKVASKMAEAFQPNH